MEGWRAVAGWGRKEEEGGITHLTKTYIFWFLYLLYYWLLSKWSFRSSAYSNRRKLNINNRLFPSRLLFVNKGYKWNKAGKIISTPWSWLSGTWSTCTFPQPSLEALACLPVWTPLQVQNTSRCGNFYSIKGLHVPVWPFQAPFPILSKISSEPLMLWLQKCRAKDFWKHRLCLLLGSEVCCNIKPTVG